MSDLRKAAEMALDALHNIDQSNNYDAIEALREALAQSVDAVNMTQERVDETVKNRHEPVAWLDPNENRSDEAFRFGKQEHHTIPLYTAPPKREWVGLTDEEIEECKIDGGLPHTVNWRLSAKVVQAKLKEKNT